MAGERTKERKERREKKRKKKINYLRKKSEMTSFWAIKNSVEEARLKPRWQAGISSREYKLGRKPLRAIAAFLNR